MRSFLRWLVFALWFCLLCLLLSYKAMGATPTVASLMTADGRVSCIHQWQGYQWWCTSGGLWQVKAKAGKRPQRHRLWHTGHGLPHLHVRALLPRGKHLWIGTERGLAMATWRNGNLVITSTLPIKRIRAMQWWRKRLWVATFGHGLYAVTPGKQLQRWELSREERGALSQRNRLTAMAVFQRHLYFGTAGKGIGVLRPNHRLSRRLRPKWFSPGRQLPGGFVFRLLPTPQGILAATEAGLVRLRQRRRGALPKVVQRWSADNLVRKGFLPSIVGMAWTSKARPKARHRRCGKRSTGQLWLCSVGGRIGTLQRGVLFQLAPRTNISLCHIQGRSLWIGTAQTLARQTLNRLHEAHNPRLETVHRSGLPSRNIASLAWDGRHLWLGAFDKGVHSMDMSQKPHHRRWRHHKEVFHQVNHVVAGPKGSIWVATNRGLYRKQRHAKRFYRRRRGLCDVHTNGIFAGQRRVVIASVTGVSVYDQRRRRWRCYNKRRGLKHQHFFATTIGPKGKIWVGGSDGLVSLDKRGKWRFYSTLQRHLPDDWVTTLYRHEQTLWIGTYANGIATHKPGKRRWQIDGRMRKRYVNPNAIAMTRYGLMIGTMQGLFVQPKGRAQYAMTPAQGLPGIDVTAIVTTHKDIWLATRHGLARLQ